MAKIRKCAAEKLALQGKLSSLHTSGGYGDGGVGFRGGVKGGGIGEYGSGGGLCQYLWSKILRWSLQIITRQKFKIWIHKFEERKNWQFGAIHTQSIIVVLDGGPRNR